MKRAMPSATAVMPALTTLQRHGMKLLAAPMEDNSRACTNRVSHLTLRGFDTVT